MLIKNVSTRILRFEEFPLEKPLLPGRVMDLSKYPPAEREACQTLKDGFDRGELICIGYATPTINPQGKTITKNAINPLQKYEIKAEQLSQDRVLIPKKQNLQPTVTGQSLNRRDSVQKNPIAPERYNGEALEKYKILQEQEEIPPEFQEKDFVAPTTHSFVQIQDEEQVVTVSVDENTNIMYATDLQPGDITFKVKGGSNVFVDDTKYTEEMFEDPAKQNELIKKKEELKAKLEKKIAAIVESKCLAPKTNGKPCERPILKGYRACFEHLSRADKQKYLQELANAKRAKNQKA